MASLDSVLKFIAGGAAGTAVGLVVGSLLAPQKGSELQAATHQRLSDARAAGAEAERETERAMQDRFRQRVGDPTAFTPEANVGKGHRS